VSILRLILAVSLLAFTAIIWIDIVITDECVRDNIKPVCVTPIQMSFVQFLRMLGVSKYSGNELIGDMHVVVLICFNFLFCILCTMTLVIDWFKNYGNTRN
jgi:hypothetical protein